MFRERKAGKTGTSADSLADALFWIFFSLRFRRPGELHVESVRKFISILLDGYGEEVLNTCIITAGRGYGNDVFMELKSEFVVASVFMIAEQLLKGHPLFAASCLNPSKEDD